MTLVFQFLVGTNYRILILIFTSLKIIVLKVLYLFFFLSVSGISVAATLQINLKHVFGSEELILAEKGYVSNSGDKVNFTRLKYYIGNVALSYEDGVTFTDSVRYHLVDFDKPESLMLELNNVPEGTIKNIEFSIGVDSLTNANGLMDGDLDPLRGMYWAWSSGFINFKLEGTCLSCEPEKEFTYHIGGFIAPYESFQVTNIPVEKKITNDDLELDMVVDIGTLFIEKKASEFPNIMSPSEKSKNFAKTLPQIFSIK